MPKFQKWAIKNVIKNVYLYDWGANKSLTPQGWHRSTKAEWENLHTDLDGNDKAVFEQI